MPQASMNELKLLLAEQKRLIAELHAQAADDAAEPTTPPLLRSASPAKPAAEADGCTEDTAVPLGQRPWYEIARMSIDSPAPSQSPSARQRPPVGRPRSVSASAERAEIGMLVDEWIDETNDPAPPVGAYAPEPPSLAGAAPLMSDAETVEAVLATSRAAAADAARARAARLDEWLRCTSAQAEAQAEAEAGTSLPLPSASSPPLCANW